MLDVRFPKTKNGISAKTFIHLFSKMINELLLKDENIHFVFFPRIYKDINFFVEFTRDIVLESDEEFVFNSLIEWTKTRGDLEKPDHFNFFMKNLRHLKSSLLG